VAQGQADASVIRARGEADARLIQAEAEAKALERLSQALENQPELLQYNFINRIAPGVQTVFLPNDVPYLFPLPTGSASSLPGVTLAPTPAPTAAAPAPAPTPTPLPTATP
jgi:regulator of protease activity HflC (stomatin/prohibitin superfamily)